MSRALEIAQRHTARAQENRAAFPFATRIVDELRAAGIETARVTFAEEDGRTIGQRGAEGVTATWWPGMHTQRRVRA